MNQKDNLNFLLMEKIEKIESEITFWGRLKRSKYKIFSLLLLLAISYFFYYFFLQKVSDKVLQNKTVSFEVVYGDSVSQVSKNLKKLGYINSEYAFRICEKIIGNGDTVISGIYKISSVDNTISLCKKIGNGKYDIPPIKIIIKEGFDNTELVSSISDSVKEYQSDWNNISNMDSLSQDSLLKFFESEQGYLFPDTYFFLPNISPQILLNKLKINFKNKLQDIIRVTNSGDKTVHIYDQDLKELDIENSLLDKDGYINKNKKLTIVNSLGTTTVSIREIINMASYLEGEARGEQDMKTVSGILWNRLKIGMYLQIDAATSTYKAKGMTKNPINNPGAVAIEAAINPIKTGYIYYITDNDGVMRYAGDYDTHLKNIKKYLRNQK